MNINLNTFLIIVGFLLLWFFRNCGEGGNGGTTDTLRTETKFIFDTTIHTVTTHKITYKDTVVITPQNVDTSQVIKDYFTRYSFVDSLADSNIIATYSASVFKNALETGDFSYRLLRPTAIVNNTIISCPKVRKVFLGGFTGYENDKPSLGGAASYMNKKEDMFFIHYDLIGKNDNRFPPLRVGVQKKIKF